MLAVAAFLQIFYNEYKTKSLRPKLVILPDFAGTPLPSGIVFYVYNVGKSTAKNCSVNLTIIYKTPTTTKSRHINWTWTEYNKTLIQSTGKSGVFFDTSSENCNFININPTQKASLSLLIVNTLYGEPLADNQEIPPMRFKIRVEVYSENMTNTASYPLELNWNGKTFNTVTEQIKFDSEHKVELEQMLWKENRDELFNLRKHTFYKRKHKR